MATMCLAIRRTRLKMIRVEAQFKLRQNKWLETGQGIVAGLSAMDSTAAWQMVNPLK